MKKRLGIFISGRGSNMRSLVEACQTGILKDCYEPVLVFSNNPQAGGLAWAAEQGIPCLSLDSKQYKRQAFEQELLELMKPYALDCIALAGFMRVLSPWFVGQYPKRIVNIHPADTQWHQGLGGYEWAWEQRLKQTKITIHWVDEGLDTGQVILQEEVNLEGVQSLEEVMERGLAVEHRAYPQALKTLFNQL
jgi:phosphoribosylglycinamide formyltransferase-1